MTRAKSLAKICKLIKWSTAVLKKIENRSLTLPVRRAHDAAQGLERGTRTSLALGVMQTDRVDGDGGEDFAGAR